MLIAQVNTFATNKIQNENKTHTPYFAMHIFTIFIRTLAFRRKQCAQKVFNVRFNFMLGC